MIFRKLGIAVAAALALSAAPPAFADTTIGTGAFWTHDGSTDGGLLGSYNLFAVPLVPINLQVSAAVPFGAGGRFAATFEGQYRFSKIFVGAGVGGGKMNQYGSGGMMYDFLGGVRVAHNVSVQARYYGSGSGTNGSATYAGLFWGLK